MRDEAAPSRLAVAVIATALAACGAACGCAPCPASVQPEPEPDPDPGPPHDFVPAIVKAVVPTPQGNAMVLESEAEGLRLPVFIGDAEAAVIRMRLAGGRFERPLTHDLLDALLAEMGAQIVRVLVTKLRGDVFIGTVVVRQGGRLIRVDARPSDAVALAVGNNVPIFVARSVLQSAGVPIERRFGP
ncbi:MAG: bifunctional nuclease family protein [Myxococcota bacterium]|nr:bifunctional nuclease family protein [Myxococcota bacterium]